MTRLGLPVLTKGLIRWLQQEHQPRCYDGSSEKLEEHLKYAGKVELVARLTDMYEQQKDEEDAIGALARQEAEALEAEADLMDDFETSHVELHSRHLDHH